MRSLTVGQDVAVTEDPRVLVLGELLHDPVGPPEELVDEHAEDLLQKIGQKTNSNIMQSEQGE